MWPTPHYRNLNLTHWCMWPLFSHIPAFQDLQKPCKHLRPQIPPRKPKVYNTPKSMKLNIRCFTCTTSEISTFPKKLERSTCIFRDLSSNLVSLFQRIKISWKAREIHLTEYSPTAVASSHPVCVGVPLHSQSSTKILMLQDSTRFLNYSPFPGKEM